MGEMADLLMDQMFNGMVNQAFGDIDTCERERRELQARAKANKYRNRLNRRLWTQTDGLTIHISNMETDHIENCIKLLERRGFVGKSMSGIVDKPTTEWIDIFMEEIQKRINNDTYVDGDVLMDLGLEDTL